MTSTAPPPAIAEAFARSLAMDAPLPEQLASFANAARALNPTFGAAVDALVGRLEAQHVGASSPGPGEPMPPFHLPDERGRLVSLESLLAGGPAVVIFHRGHWCPYCRISSKAIARAQGRIEALGGQMVAITPDLQPYAQKLKAFAGSTFPFLTDVDNGYAMSINLVFWVGAAMEPLMKAVGSDVPRFQGSGSWLMPLPAVFVVGRDGRVAARFLDPDYRRRMAVDDLVAAVAGAAT
jgi:peroxiredoxin